MSDVKDNVHQNDIVEGDLGKITDSLDGAAAGAVPAHEVDNATAVIDELMKIAIGALDERLATKGIRTAPMENLKLRAAKKGLEMAQRYSTRFNAEARLDHFVNASNKALPTIVEIFGEKALADHIRPHVTEPQKMITLLDAAGATEASKLVRNATSTATAVAAPAAPAAPKVA